MRALLLLLLLSFSVGYGQTISGYVFDEAENKPMEGAFVYLDGTTISANTNAQGFFTITTAQKYNAALVISYMGFESLRIEDPYKFGKPFKVMLREDAIMLNEVVISKGGPFTRKQMLRAFRKNFLGDRGGSRCKIENEDDINLHYNTTDNTLVATSNKPLIIINKYLEYKVAFDLQDFQVNYSYTSIDDASIRQSFFAGTTFFTDLAKEHGADKKRKEAYLGSPVHFMRTMASGDWKKENYQLYADKVPVEHSEYFKVSDSANYKKVEIIDIPQSVKNAREQLAKGGLTFLKDKKGPPPAKFAGVKFLVTHGKEQTTLSFNNGYFYIDENGLFFPLFEVIFGGYMGELKAGDLLPVDYKYVP